MNVKILFSLCFCACLSHAQQSSLAPQYAQLIEPAELRENLAIIASDALEGRSTGSRGEKMAAAFIAYHFQQIGLDGPIKNSYYQTYKLGVMNRDGAYLIASSKKFMESDGFYHPGPFDNGGEENIEVIFVGKGEEEDFRQVNVKGKAVLVWIDEIKPNPRFFELGTRAKNAGAKYIFYMPPATDKFPALKSMLATPILFLGAPPLNNTAERIYVKSEIGESIMNMKIDKMKAIKDIPASKSPLKKIKPGYVTLYLKKVKGELATDNLMGLLPGTDRSDELVVITAHYDHIRKKTEGEGDLINNGADDNGSGVVALMQLAKAFAQARKDGNGPRRSMLFIAFSGEEDGLFGSEYYVTNPVFPLEKTVVNLNMDMIGSIDTINSKIENYMFLIGSDRLSSELHEISERMNNTYTKLVLNYLFNDEKHPSNQYYRSDHWNFVKNDIPSICYLDGEPPDYHQPTDEIDKINFDLLTRRAQCIFYTAWEIANKDTRLSLDKKK
jgi:Zn-dependent M28 family amino/carboxypeptidase